MKMPQMAIIADSLHSRVRGLALGLCLMLAAIGCVIPTMRSGANRQNFPQDPRVDRSFVTGNPCSAPCWHGLRLGESNIEDIRTTLAELQFIDKARIEEYPSKSPGPAEKLFLAGCVYSQPTAHCVALETSSTGKLSKVIADVDYPLSLAGVIDQLGPPKFYTVDLSPNGQVCSFRLYWPDREIIADIEEGPRQTYCPTLQSSRIDPAIQVSSFTYTRINEQQFQGGNSQPWESPTP